MQVRNALWTVAGLALIVAGILMLITAIVLERQEEAHSSSLRGVEIPPGGSVSLTNSNVGEKNELYLYVTTL